MSNGNTKWLVILGVGLAVSLAVNSYFLGQRSADQGDTALALIVEEGPSPKPDIEASAPTRQVLAYGDGRDTGAARLEQDASGELVIHNTNPTTPPPRAAATRVAADGDQANIAAYFAKVDALSTNTTAPNTTEYAQTLMQASLNGDTTELKKLQAELDAMRMAVKQVSPPKACAAYHEKSLALLTASGALLAKLEKAFRTKDTAGLGQVAQTAHSLQSQTSELQDLRKRLLGD